MLCANSWWSNVQEEMMMCVVRNLAVYKQKQHLTCGSMSVRNCRENIQKRLVLLSRASKEIAAFI